MRGAPRIHRHLFRLATNVGQKSGLALACALVVAAASGARADVRPVPYLSGRVVDEAALLSPEARTALEGKLASLEKETKAQVAVLTVASLDGEPIEGFSIRVAETWKLGEAQRDDGVLFVIARDDRKMRIEVGYGLEPKLTDIRSRRILDDLVRPRFRSGDYGGGIEAGVDAIGAELRGEEQPPAPPPAPSPPLGWGPRLLVSGMLLVLVLVFGFAGTHSPGCVAWIVYLVVTPFVAILGAVATTPEVGLGLAASWLIGYPIYRNYLRRAGKLPKPAIGTLRGSKGSRGWIFDSGSSSSSSSSSDSGSSWSSSSSSFDSGSSFSGGGGSFGGGGSSSSW